MGFLHLYARVLAKLGPDSGSGWLLALANVAVAVALFAEPVLFGRVINVLAGAQADAASTDWTSLWLLLLAWAGFGLFTIICGTLIALFADRLAHRRRLAVLTSYFEHVLQLPLAYHGETHSGRLMKTMLQGTDALWAFWLGFFREHLAAFVSLFLLVPLALFLDWRMAILLVVLCIVFAALTALMLRKTETLQSIAQTHHSDLADCLRAHRQRWQFYPSSPSAPGCSGRG
jgi:ATP-binding cassette subfamily B protein